MSSRNCYLSGCSLFRNHNASSFSSSCNYYFWTSLNKYCTTGHSCWSCILSWEHTGLLTSVCSHRPNPGDGCHPSSDDGGPNPGDVPSVGNIRNNCSSTGSNPKDHNTRIPSPMGYIRNSCSNKGPNPKSYPNRKSLPSPNDSNQSSR